MNKHLTSLDKSIIEEIRARREKKYEILRRIQSFESPLCEKLHLANLEIIQKSAEKLGVDMQPILEEAQRQSEVRRRMIESKYARIRADCLTLVQEEAERRREMRKRYLELHAEWYKAKEGNPLLKFREPLDDWTTIIRVPDLLGEAPRGWDFSETDAIEIDYDAWTKHFYPWAHVRTGDDCPPMHLEFIQTVVLRHDPLESGRGDFETDELIVDLSGTGYSESRMGDPCGLGPGTNIWDMTELTLRVTLVQNGMYQTILNERLHQGVEDHAEPVEVEAAAFPLGLSLLLLSPDRGGSEIWLLVDLLTRVSAGDKHAHAELNFSREDTTGLELGCVMLEGNYTSG